MKEFNDSITRTSIRGSNTSRSTYEERIKESSIRMLNLELSDCKIEIKKLKGDNISAYNKKELHHHNKALELALKKREILSKRLASLGCITDRRGRPKKKESEKYKSVNQRMTIYFNQQNYEYLKAFKSNGSISNISSFINELVSLHINISGDESI